MQREERGLGQEASGHQPRRQPYGGFGPNAFREDGNVERAIGAVEQRDSEQIEHRAEQREQEIAQRRGDRLGAPVETNQRNGGEGEKLEPDVEIEQVPAQEEQARPRLDALQQGPKDQRRALFLIARRRKIAPRVQRGGRRDQSRRHEHHCRESVGPERYAERGAWPASV